MNTDNLKPSEVNGYDMNNPIALTSNIEMLKTYANYKPDTTITKNVDMFNTIKEIAKKAGAEGGDVEQQIAELTTKIEDLDTKIEEGLDSAIKLVDFGIEKEKCIALENHQNLLGKKLDGNAVNIGMVSKWDVVDLGSSTTKINLNGSEARPTYNDTNEIALSSDLIALQIIINALEARIVALEP